MLLYSVGETIKHSVCMVLLGKDNLKFAISLSWTLICILFGFADFNLYPFTVINHNQESNNFSEFCEPSNESLNRSAILGTPNTPQ